MHKLSVILLGLLICSATLFSQSSILQKTITIRATEGTVGSILKQISTSGRFSFSYGQDISCERHVSLKSSRQTVKQFLDELFNGQVYYVEFGNKIILLQRPDLPDVYTLRGRVIDGETKEPIPGATVYIPGSDPLMGTISDKQGYFELVVPSDADRVELSCVGYKTDLLFPDRKSDASVELNPERQELSEVQIVYYKPAKETDVNNAVSVISSKKMRMNTSASIEEILQGNASGVHVVRNSGMPGASMQVKVRGMKSLINCDPIYYLDGVYLQQSSLNFLSPHDIESVEVLKDASGTAKYGASAGNGVVLLHSKKGEPGKVSCKFNYTFGHQQIWKKPDLLNKEEFIYWFDKFRPSNKTFQEYYNKDTIESLVNSDWIEVVFHGAKTEDYHFAVCGGNKSSVFYISTGYYKQEAIIGKLEMNRYSFKIRSNHTLGKRLEFGEDVSLAFLDMKGFREGCFMNDFNNPILGAFQMLPTYNKDSIHTRFYNDYASYSSVPTDNLDLSRNARKNYYLFSNIYTHVKLFKGLTYSTRLGLELCFQDNISFRPIDGRSGRYAVGSTYNIRDLAFDWQHVMEYSTLIADYHSLRAFVEFEYGQINNKWIPLLQTAVDNDMNPLDDSETTWEEPFSTDFIHHAWSGYFEYSYQGRYQLEINVRKEKIGYYELYKDFRHLEAIYPSFALGWIFIHRNISRFFRIDYGKLRFGMGKTGISPRLNYAFFANTIREAQYFYALSDDISQIRSPSIRRTNEKLFWEQLHGTNVGLDLGIFNNKLFLTFDYFYDLLKRGKTYPISKPNDIILELEGMESFGIYYPRSAGTMNSGFEGEVSWRMSYLNLKVESGVNFSHIKNEIVDIQEEDIQIAENTISVHLPGEAAGSFYGYKIEGLFKEEDCDRNTGQVTNQPYTINDDGDIVYAQPNAEAGDYKFGDVNNDGNINSNDKIILGNPHPDFTLGFYQSLQYRNFDFSIFLQGVWGNEIFNVTKYWTYNPYGFSNWTIDIANSYRPPGENDDGFTNTDQHRVDAEDSNHNLTRVSDFYIEDGSYLRLKNVQFGYTIPARISQRIHIQKFRIWLGAQNLFTWTRYSGLDPEVGGWGIDCGIYPQPRVYLAGVNVEF